MRPMKRMITSTLTALYLTLPLALASTGAPAAQEDGNCVTALTAQQAVEAGEILELPVAARREGLEQKFIGDEARLCEIGGAPHWVVNVMSPAGDSERVVLNARAD
jgi:hypothetical protein